MSVTGLTTLTPSPPLPPGPNRPSPSRCRVGMKIGRITASDHGHAADRGGAGLARAGADAEAVGVARPRGPPSGRPQRVMWADSCRNIISRKPDAASRKTTHETPSPITLIGTQ